MKNTIKKSLSLLLMVLTILSSMSVMASAAGTTIIASGQSNDIHWSIDSNGTILFEGDGEFEIKNAGCFFTDKNGEDYFMPGVVAEWREYADKIVKADVRIKNTRNLCGFLSSLPNLREVDFSKSDTSKALVMACMFYNCDSLETIDLRDLKTDSAISFGNMFAHCDNLKSVDTRGWKTGEVTGYGSMFDCCESLEEVKGIEDWDTSAMTEAFLMFQCCPNIKSFDLSKWDTSNLVMAFSMFSQCSSLESLNIGTWNVENLIDASRMFYCCVNLGEMNLKNWNLKNIVDIEQMFGWCYNLNGSIGFTSNVPYYEYAFYASTVSTDKDFIIYYSGDCTRENAKAIADTNQCDAKVAVYDDPIRECFKGNHKFDKGRVISKASCAEEGEKVFTCSACGESKYEKISKLTTHNPYEEPAVSPTCTESGLTKGSICRDCGLILTEQKYVPATGHSWGKASVVTKATCKKEGLKTYICTECGDMEYEKVAKTTTHNYKNVLTKATLSEDGMIVSKCSDCGKTKSITPIPSVNSIKLSSTSYTYDGKAKKPTVTVTDDDGKTLTKDTDYTVTYSNNTESGTATAKVAFKGNYTGTKNITFKIVPAQVTGLKASSVATTSLKLSWSKVNGAKYYKVEQSADGKTWKTVTTTDKTSYAVSNLTAGSKLQFRVTALDSTKKVAGKVSAVLKTGTKTAAPTVTLKSSKSKTATASWKKVTGAGKYIVYKSTDNKKWTKAGETTKLTFDLTKLTGGKKIYVKVVAVNAYNQNSAYSKVASITVKK